VNWADLMAAQGAYGTDSYDRSILRLKHRAYYRAGRPVIKIGPNCALGSYEIRPIHSSPSLGQSIQTYNIAHGILISTLQCQALNYKFLIIRSPNILQRNFSTQV